VTSAIALKSELFSKEIIVAEIERASLALEDRLQAAAPFSKVSAGEFWCEFFLICSSFSSAQCEKKAGFYFLPGQSSSDAIIIMLHRKFVAAWLRETE
jgi:hypothetical protein